MWLLQPHVGLIWIVFLGGGFAFWLAGYNMDTIPLGEFSIFCLATEFEQLSSKSDQKYFHVILGQWVRVRTGEERQKFQFVVFMSMSHICIIKLNFNDSCRGKCSVIWYRHIRPFDCYWNKCICGKETKNEDELHLKIDCIRLWRGRKTTQNMLIYAY